MRTLVTTCLSSALLFAVACEKADADTASPEDAQATPVEEPDPGPDAVAPAEEPEPEPEPTLTVTSFEETVQENMQDALDCYTTAKAENSKIGSKLVADFKIDGEGNVTEVAAQSGSTLTDAGVLTCIKDKANGWDLPPPPGGNPTNMRFPFEFGG